MHFAEKVPAPKREQMKGLFNARIQAVQGQFPFMKMKQVRGAAGSQRFTGVSA